MNPMGHSVARADAIIGAVERCAVGQFAEKSFLEL